MLKNKMEQFPRAITKATHVVLSSTRRAPMLTKPSYFESDHSNGDIIDMLPNGKRIIVLDEAVGWKGTWAKVLVEGVSYGRRQKLYIKKEFLKKLPDTPPSVPYTTNKKSMQNPSIPPLIDWTKLGDSDVVLDKHTAEYKCCVHMVEQEYRTTGGPEEIYNRLEEATKIGLTRILKHLAKDSTSDYVSFLVNKVKNRQVFQLVKAPEYYVSTRLSDYLKVLVVLPARYVKVLDNAKGVSQFRMDAKGNVLVNARPRRQDLLTYEDGIRSKKALRRIDWSKAKVDLDKITSRITGISMLTTTPVLPFASATIPESATTLATATLSSEAAANPVMSSYFGAPLAQTTEVFLNPNLDLAAFADAIEESDDSYREPEPPGEPVTGSVPTECDVFEEAAFDYVMTAATRWDAEADVELRCVYKTNKFMENIESAAEVLRGHIDSISSFEGTVLNYDPEQEASRLEQIPAILSTLFEDNNLPYNPLEGDREEELEIGWNDMLEIVFVSLTNISGGTVAMSRGLDRLKDSTPLDSQRTNGYLWQLNLMISDAAVEREWTDYITAFTLPEPPQILPSMDNANAVGDLTANTSTAERARQRMDASEVLIYQEKIDEDRLLNDPEFRAQVKAERKDWRDFVGSNITTKQGLVDTLNKVTTVDSAFEKVLNKMNIAELIGQAMQCVTPTFQVEPACPDLSAQFDAFESAMDDAIDAKADLQKELNEPFVGEKPLVELEYEQDPPADPCEPCNVEAALEQSVSDFGLTLAAIADLGLLAASLVDLGVGTKTYNEVAPDTDLSGTALGDRSIGSLLGSPNILSETPFNEMQFDDDVTLDQLEIDVSSYTIEEIGLADVRIGDAGFVLEDLGLDEEYLESEDIDPEENLVGQDEEDLTFRQLKIHTRTIGDLDLSDVKAADLMIEHTLGHLDANLDEIRLKSVGSVSANDLGIGDVSFDDLGASDNSFEDMGLGNATLGDLGLENESLDALGLSGMDLENAKDNLARAGYADAVANIDALGLEGSNEDEEEDSPGTEVETPDTENAKGLDECITDFAKQFRDALEKVAELTGCDIIGNTKKKLESPTSNPFEQCKPKFPVDIRLNIPDELPTEDIMESLTEALERILEAMLTMLFLAMVRATLEMLISLCEEDAAGDDNGPSNDPLNGIDNDDLTDLAAALGLGGEGDPSRSPFTDDMRQAFAKYQNAMRDFISDVAAVLTTREFCTLLQSFPSESVLQIVLTISRSKYSILGLDTKTKIIDFFAALGTLIPASICTELTNQNPMPGPVAEIWCQTVQTSHEMKALIGDKQDGITDAQLDAIIEAARQRKVDAAKMLADFVNKGPLSEDFEPPAVFCQKGGPSGNKKGMMDLSHPSIDFMMDKAIENTFMPIEVAWSEDAKRYPFAFTVESEDEQQELVDIYVHDGGEDGPSILNPTIEQRYGSEAAALAVAKSQGTESDKTVKVPLRVRRACPTLHSSLRNMETDDTLDFTTFEKNHPLFNVLDDMETDDISTVRYSYYKDNGGYGLKMKVPLESASDMAAAVESISNMEDGDMREQMEQAMSAVQAAIPNFTIYFILPNISQDLLQLQGESSATELLMNRNLCLIVVTQTKGTGDSVYESIVYHSMTDSTVSNEIAENLSSDKFSIEDFPSDSTLPLPQYYFAKLIKDSVSNAEVANEDLELLYNMMIESGDGSVYAELSRDIIAYIAQRIANGPLFHNIDVGDGVAAGATKIKTSVPMIEYLDFNPEALAEEIAKGQKPSLLSIEELKKCAKDEVKKATCIDLNAPTDGSQRQDLSPEEEVLMQKVMSLIIRTYITDHYIRGIFTNASFKPPSEPSEATVNHIIKFMTNDMALYDEPRRAISKDGTVKHVGEPGTYLSDFTTKAVEMNIPSLEEAQEVTLEEDGGTAGYEGEHLEKKSLQGLIKKEYSQIIDNLIGVTSSRSLESLSEDFIARYLKTFSISDIGAFGSKFFGDAASGDFTTQLDSIVNASAAVQFDIFAEEAAKLAELAGSSGNEFSNLINEGLDAESVEQGEVASGVSMSEIDYSNGNMFLETYYLIEDHDEKPAWWDTKVLEDSIFYREWAAKGGVSFDKLPAKNYKYYGVVSDSAYSEMSTEATRLGLKLSKKDLSAFGTESHAVFKSVKRGVRLMYLPPTTDADMFSHAFQSPAEDIDSDTKFKAVWNSSSVNYEAGADLTVQQQFRKTMSNISVETAIKTKAYKVIEEIDSDDISVASNPAGQNVEPDVFKYYVGLYKETNPIPLIDLSWEFGFHKTPGSSITSIGSTDPITVLSSSKEYKTLIEYIFPVESYKSVLSLYSFHYTSSLEEVALATSSTKDALRMVFNSINSKGSYKQNDPAMENVGGMTGLMNAMNNEFGVLEMPASPSSWNYNASTAWGKTIKGLGFEAVAKATADAVKKLYKTTVEKSDPNIKVAHKLMKISKIAGVNIPTTAWSFAILPVNVFPPPPLGPGFGPPLTPFGFGYHAMGLGGFKSVVDIAKDALAENGLEPERPEPKDECVDKEKEEKELQTKEEESNPLLWCEND